jgi:hypothetical protein
MTRTIVTIVLLVAMTQAQVADRSNGAVATQLGEVKRFRELAGVRKPEIHGTVDFQYDKLRQGTSEFAHVALMSMTRGFAIADPLGKESRVEPMKLELKASKGIQVVSVLYPASELQQFPFDPKPFKVLKNNGAEPIRVRFKVRALPDLVPGDYVVKATLSYRLISEAGISEPQQLRVEVPIQVVERKTKVKTEDRSIAGILGVTAAEWTENILLAPLMIPVAIFMTLIGWDGC